jgi:hypothetical protein
LPTTMPASSAMSTARRVYWLGTAGEWPCGIRPFGSWEFTP